MTLNLISTMNDRLLLEHLHRMEEDLMAYIWDNTELIGGMVNAAQVLGAIFALIYVARICYASMSGQKPFDFLAIGRPILISLVLANWFLIAQSVFSITRPIERVFREGCSNRVDSVDAKRELRLQLAAEFSRELKRKGAESKTAEAMKNVDKEETQDKDIPDRNQGEGASNIESESFSDLFSVEYISASLIVSDAQASDVVYFIVYWLGETFWELCVYFVFLARYIGMGVLILFGPITMAASILPTWKDGWNEWLGRAITVSLYGALGYFFMNCGLVIIEYALDADIELLRETLSSEEPFMSYLRFFSDSATGTLGVYLIALLTGAMLMSTVPEVATWIFPSAMFRGAGYFYSGMHSAVRESATLAAVVVTAGVAGVAAASKVASVAGGSGDSGGGGDNDVPNDAQTAVSPKGPAGGPTPGGEEFRKVLVPGTGSSSGKSQKGSAGSGTSHTRKNMPVAGEAETEQAIYQDYGSSFDNGFWDDALTPDRTQLEQLKDTIARYERALAEGRGEEFIAMLGVGRQSRHPGIDRLEQRFIDVHGNKTAREALSGHLDRLIDLYEEQQRNPQGWLQDVVQNGTGTNDFRSQVEHLKRRVEDYDRADATGHGLELEISELQEELNRSIDNEGRRQRPFIEALEARYLQDRRDPKARRELLQALDQLLQQYGRDDSAGPAN